MNSAEIKKLFGKDLVDSSETRLVYSFDASPLKGKVIGVIRPASVERVKELIKTCYDNRVGVVVRGSGTGLAGGSVPRNNVVLDLSCLNKILGFDEARGLVRCEAGVILDDLNHYLEGFGVFFPVIPGSHAACSIGGMIACNAVGMRGVMYGETKDWVESLDVITGSGELKKVSGNELKDFVGLEGLTGVIVKACLRTTKEPEKRFLVVKEFEELKPLVRMVDEFRGVKGVSAIEFVSKRACELSGWGDKNLLIIEFSDAKPRGDYVEGEARVSEVWFKRDGLGPKLIEAGYPYLEDPKIPHDKLLEFLEWFEENSVPVFGHVGVGILHPHFKEGSALITEMYQLVMRLGGWVSGEHGIGSLKKEWLNESKKKELGRLKRVYDPRNIINPGKVI